MGSRLFNKQIRHAIAAIYGFVRIADEIVDTFHDAPQSVLLEEFKRDTDLALDRKISINPVLHAFQQVVHQYGIERSHIDCFLKSMSMDLAQVDYDKETYDEYILGSAEVVGLMCLHIFVDGDKAAYERLKPAAMQLGSAFQKVNFLRDIRHDNIDLGRQYFPGIKLGEGIDANMKKQIEKEISDEFDGALEGIKQLPSGSCLGVYVAYIYYRKLLSKIVKVNSVEVMSKRIRVPNRQKFILLFWSVLKYRLHLI